MHRSTSRRPLLDAIHSGAWKTLLGTLITAGVTFGLLNAEQATVVNNIVAAAATLLTMITSAVAQWHILGKAEPAVTPVADPRDDAGTPLRPSSSS
ncbi:hypothetical protein [Amycolatopsis sp. NPDC059021]|uniref:hypothetical protein n=1 Tax=Amycolatopsis sp. NPDC059021 TaxID=3346704 RepID=UPI00366DFA72